MGDEDGGREQVGDPPEVRLIFLFGQQRGDEEKTRHAAEQPAHERHGAERPFARLDEVVHRLEQHGGQKADGNRPYAGQQVKVVRPVGQAVLSAKIRKVKAAANRPMTTNSAYEYSVNDPMCSSSGYMVQ